MSRPPLRVLRAGELDPRPDAPRWLIEPLWPHPSVAIAGGQPKSNKTWLGLDAAVSVASSSPYLARFSVPEPGPALVFLAEDALPDVRERLACLCNSRGLRLDRLDLHVVAEPVLRLDLERDQERLRDVVARIRPRLLVLDPLVRLHRLDENSSQDVSGLLGYLRELQRAHDVSVLLVHHASKRAHARSGQALRGSSDIHAWADVGLYLTWRKDRLRLDVELRTAAPPRPFDVALVCDDPLSTHLAVQSDAEDRPADSAPLSRRVLELLRRRRPASMLRYELRQVLGVNNARLGEALARLEDLDLIRRSDHGWVATDAT